MLSAAKVRWGVCERRVSSAFRRSCLSFVPLMPLVWNRHLLPHYGCMFLIKVYFHNVFLHKLPVVLWYFCFQRYTRCWLPEFRVWCEGFYANLSRQRRRRHFINPRRDLVWGSQTKLKKKSFKKIEEMQIKTNIWQEKNPNEGSYSHSFVLLLRRTALWPVKTLIQNTTSIQTHQWPCSEPTPGEELSFKPLAVELAEFFRLMSSLTKDIQTKYWETQQTGEESLDQAWGPQHCSSISPMESTSGGPLAGQQNILMHIYTLTDQNKHAHTSTHSRIRTHTHTT